MFFPVQCLCTAGERLLSASNNTLHLTTNGGQLISQATIHKSLIRQLGYLKNEQGEYAVSTGEDKMLIVFSVPELQVLSTRTLTKRANQLIFDPKGNILIGDKFGDVYIFPLLPDNENDNSNKEEKYTPILGHVSMLNSLALLPTTPSLIATADRDQHIRLSMYPKGHVIHSFFWGHKKFVSSLLSTTLGNDNVLISGGGDGFLRVHRISDGSQVGAVDLGNLIKFVEVAPPAPQPTVKPKHPKKEPKKVKDDSTTSAPEGETATEVPTEEPSAKAEEPVAKEDATTEENNIIMVKTVGPHAWKDGKTTGFAVSKLAETDSCILILLAGSTILTYITKNSLLSAEPVIRHIELGYPILDFTVSGQHVTFSLDLVNGATKGTEEFVVIKSYDMDTLLFGPDTLDTAFKGFLSRDGKAPAIDSLYPVLNLLQVDPADLELAKMDQAEPALEESSSTGLKRSGSPTIVYEAEKRGKKGKKAAARTKLIERFEQKVQE